MLKIDGLKLEYAILHINGVSKKSLFKLIIYDFLWKNMVSIVLAILVYGIIWKEIVSIPTLIVLMVVLFVFEVIYVRKRLSQLYPDELLRN